MRFSSFIAVLAIVSIQVAQANPTITRQPSPRTNSVSIGARLTNRITASSSIGQAVRYQWLLNGIEVAGATNASLTITNIVLSQAGQYVARVSDDESSIESAVWFVQVDGAFTKMSTGPASVGGSTAVGWGDFNNDGWQDLFISVLTQPSFLFVNNGDGTFSRLAAGKIVTEGGNSFAGVWGDYDNDGYLDLLKGWYNGNSQLYRNLGGVSFTNVTSTVLGNIGQGENNVVWGDYDNDGFLDAFQANGSVVSRNVLLRNNRNGTFSRITNGPIAALSSGSLGAAWGDYDNDGWIDLVISRSGSRNVLFRNNGDGTFGSVTNEVTGRLWATGPMAGTSWADYDNDGFLDLFVSALAPQRNSLYRNNRDGSFTLQTNSPIFTFTGASTGGAWADYDNDGWQDLFIANQSGQPGFLYKNNGDGTFNRVITGSIANDPAEAQGASWGDANNDGFPDLLAPNIRNFNNAFYLNNGNSNHWLVIECRGRVSNRAAIGAKVRIKATILGRETWQMREISGGNSLGSQNDLRCQFGLGDATNASIVRVEWPSGIVQEITDVLSKQFFTINEPSRLKALRSDGAFRIGIESAVAVEMEQSSDMKTWIHLDAQGSESRKKGEMPLNATNSFMFFRGYEATQGGDLVKSSAVLRMNSSK